MGEQHDQACSTSYFSIIIIDHLKIINGYKFQFIKDHKVIEHP